MTTITIDRAVAEQALGALEAGLDVDPIFAGETIIALRAALAQEQADPTDPGHDVDVLREHVRHLERRVRQLAQEQAEPVADLRCAKWLDPECADKGACQSLRFKRQAALAQEQAEPKPMHPELRKMWEELAAMPQQAEPLNLSDRAVQRRLAAQWGYVPAQAEPAQEPVAKCVDDICSEHLGRVETFDHLPKGTLLYTIFPRRTMVPLTEKEIGKLTAMFDARHSVQVGIARAVEKASWEKNK